FLINPHGVVFGRNAVIDTAGLVASSLNITDQDFLQGNLRFSGDSESGSIRNQGFITAGQDGDILLVAPNIENSGIIHTEGGELILAAGEEVTITSTEGKGLHFNVQAPENEVVNLGKLLADGGAVKLFAGTLRHSGQIRADNLRLDDNGDVVLSAQGDITLEPGSRISASGPMGGRISIESRNGTTWVSGEVEAKAGEGRGGEVRLLGERVALLDQAAVDVSGDSSGGEVLIGGDYQGRNPDIHNAKAVYIGSETSIRADAVREGDGGKVIVWADDTTRFHGSISARGGEQGGDGGFIETSGKQALDIAGADIDASAPNGANGEWLLDPTDVTIVHGSIGTLAGGLFDPLLSSSIGDTQINDALNAGTDVTIQTSAGTDGSGNITVNGTADAGGAVAILNSAGGARGLTFNADGSIDMHSGASIAGSAGNSLSVDLNATGGSNVAGTIDMQGGTLGFTGGSLNLSNRISNGTVTGTTLTASNGDLDNVTLGSNLTISGVSDIYNNLTLADGVTLGLGGNTMYFRSP
ncbi:MAG: hypothetical protein GY731_15650, partial [Gammaproteobacteria bacterium]|nr:hypothetical protein [Gammaproteobacteria bacterium]